MTNDQYIKALKKALSSLDSSSRDDIVNEIQSYADEPSTGSLEERFGAPTELAKRYLDDPTNNVETAKPARSMSNKILSLVGTITLILGLALYLTFRFFTKDEFNYADTTKAEEYFSQQQWQEYSLEALSSITIRQSKVVVYWRDIDTIRLSCVLNGDVEPAVASTIAIYKSRCTVQLPNQAAVIGLDQAELILIEPMADLTINGEQSRIEIAEQENGYQYVISKSESNTNQLQSNDAAEITITMNIEQSEATPYK